MNYYLELIKKFKVKNIKYSDRVVQHILNEPFNDGGQWVMFSNIANKYGLIPKDSYPESIHSNNTEEINMVLSRMFRNYVKEIYSNNFDKNESIQKTYDILIKFLGEPPEKIKWNYKKTNNKSKNTIKSKSFVGSPKEFMKEFCNINLDNYVSLTNDPRLEKNKIYSVKYLNNLENGDEIKYLNLPINRIKELTNKSIDNNIPVWFGSDISQFLNSKNGIVDEKSFDYIKFLNIDDKLTKKERIDYRESLMTHAMIFIGYNKDNNNNINYWKIENSWGINDNTNDNVNDIDKYNDYYKGNLRCSDKWFDDYVYQIIIEKKMLNKNELLMWNNNKIYKYLPLWDPMGSLA